MPKTEMKNYRVGNRITGFRKETEYKNTGLSKRSKVEDLEL